LSNYRSSLSSLEIQKDAYEANSQSLDDVTKDKERLE
jgi:hypothetical protein